MPKAKRDVARPFARIRSGIAQDKSLNLRHLRTLIFIDAQSETFQGYTRESVGKGAGINKLDDVSEALKGLRDRGYIQFGTRKVKGFHVGLWIKLTDKFYMPHTGGGSVAQTGGVPMPPTVGKSDAPTYGGEQMPPPMGEESQKPKKKTINPIKGADAPDDDDFADLIKSELHPSDPNWNTPATWKTYALEQGLSADRITAMAQRFVSWSARSERCDQDWRRTWATFVKGELKDVSDRDRQSAKSEIAPVLTESGASWLYKGEIYYTGHYLEHAEGNGVWFKEDVDRHEARTAWLLSKFDLDLRPPLNLDHIDGRILAAKLEQLRGRTK